MTQTFAQKLNLKPGQTLSLVNPPPGMVAALLDWLPENPLVSTAAPVDLRSIPHAAVLVFLTRQSETAALMEIFAALQPDGVTWAAYPKGGSKVPTDLNRDILWNLTGPSGLRPVRMVALDETWSAMRFKREEAKNSTSVE